MYQLLIEIHNFRQLIKIARGSIQGIIDEIAGLSELFGAALKDLGQGRVIITFLIHRPSDTAFVVDAVFRLYDFLLVRKHDMAGFSLLLESGSNDEEGERHLRQLLIRATQDEALWFGSLAAAALSQYVYLENTGSLWRALSRNSSQNVDLNINDELIGRFSAIDTIEDALTTLIKNGNSNIQALCVAGEESDAVGDMVNFVLSKQVPEGHKSSCLWLLGQNENDPAPIALTRTLFAHPESLIIENLDEDEINDWKKVRRFMFQNAHSSIPEVPPSHINLEYPLELFYTAWRIYLTALMRRCSKIGIPFYLHIENYQAFNQESRKLIDDTISLFGKGIGANVIIILSSSSFPEDTPTWIEHAETIEIKPLSWAALSELALPVETLPSALLFSKNLYQISRRQAANIAYLCKRYAGSSDAPLALAGIQTEVQINRALLNLILQSCDELVREVYYTIVITYGLLPVFLIFDFLSFIAVERIRHPALIQNLFRLGLIRDEELVIPAYPHCADELEILLGDRATGIRRELETFLAQRMKKGNLALRLDVFILMADIAAPDNFFDICFSFAQELLNVRNFATASYVLDHASVNVRQVSDVLQKNRLIHALAYLNCRSLLIQSRTTELQLAFSHLNQLGELSGQVISAYVQAQKARVHYYLGDIDQALIAVKRAVMQFQDCNDRVGLSASQILFGQILLGKERLIEARDYFILARNNATSKNAIYEDVLAGVYDIVVTFVLGYHSRALEALSDPLGVLESARVHGLCTHVTFLEFLKGRVWFELGAYHEAKDAFELSGILSERYSNTEAGELSRRWYARCEAFLGNYSSAENLLARCENNIERDAFTAESYILQERFGEAHALLTLLDTGHSVPGNLQPETIHWKDGFANLEGKVFLGINQQGVLANLIHCYRLYCGARLGSATEAVEVLFAFTRNTKRSLIDPANYFYFFLYSQTLKFSTGEKPDDYATTLGKAVKFIQERASRIEDPGHKQSFLRSSYWNRLLLQDAKIQNLA